MSSCCPDCGSAATVGAEVASVCTDCGAAAVAGFTFSLPALVVSVVATAVVVVAARRIARLARAGRRTVAAA